MDGKALWARYREFFYEDEPLGLQLDVSRVQFPASFLTDMAAPMAKAFAAMDALEAGAIANPDEKRMVGHYWLRAPSMSPSPEIRKAIEETLAKIERFCAGVHGGKTRGSAGAFRDVIVVGIGGSALGPQLVAAALGGAGDTMRPHFVDNTDPDGIDNTLRAVAGRLGETLTVVVSKSGGTKETRNGMLEVRAAYEAAGLNFAQHAVAVTGEGSELDQVATKDGWIERFPMWDWVGGRTSELSAVGLLPAALQGLDIRGMLDGARRCDELTRGKDVRRNPAALLALMWHFIGEGRGKKDMVVLPYKDRLLLMSRYLQQLVMESIGKERDLDGKVVHQGIAVYGNKGSTDQHAYVQQLRDGVPNFFVTFIEVMVDRPSAKTPFYVEPNVTSGDYLHGFLLGTRHALYDSDRQSITITLRQCDARAVGTLIALYERAVGLYASLVHINAYHQPGVEAGKKAATAVLALQHKIVAALGAEGRSVESLAEAAGVSAEVETAWKVLEHLAANPGRGVKKSAGKTPFDAMYSKE